MMTRFFTDLSFELSEQATQIPRQSLTATRTPCWQLLSIIAIFAFCVPSHLSGQECDNNCLRVYSIQMYGYLAADAQANVTVVDENMGLAFGAVVHGVWTRPDQTTFDQYDVIGVSGDAEFRLYSDQIGIATLRVAGIAKDGYTFDPVGSNLLSASIEINNPSALGDINRDGAVNLLDVQPFVALIAGGTFQFEADTNQDGAVNLLDVDSFINLLSN